MSTSYAAEKPTQLGSPHSQVVCTWSIPAGMSPTSLTPRSHDHYLPLLGWSTLSSGMYYSITPRSHDDIVILLTLVISLFTSM